MSDTKITPAEAVTVPTATSEIQSNLYRPLVSPTGDGYAGIVAEIEELLTPEDIDGYGVFQATPYAVAQATSLLTEAKKLSHIVWPKGSASTSPVGWIRIEWRHGSRQLRLMVPAAFGGQTYIYHESDEGHRASDDVSPLTIARWIDWLLKDD